MTTHRFFVFEQDGSFREGTEDECAKTVGDGTLVTVTCEGNDWYVIEADQHYCRLEITQDLQRALRTFAALLQHDTHEELAALNNAAG